MDRNIGTYADGAGSTGSNDVVGEVPARSSSAPPHHPGAVFTLDGAASTASAEATTNTLPTFNQPPELVGPCTSYGSLRASPIAVEKSFYSYVTNHPGHQLDLGGSGIAGSDTWSYGNRTQGMPSLTVPLGTSPSSRSGPIFDSRFRSTVLPSATPEQPMPVCSLSASNGHIDPARSIEPYYSSGSLMSRDRSISGPSSSHNVMRDDGQDPKSRNIAAWVGALDLSATPTIPTFPTHQGLEFMGGNAATKAPAGHHWFDHSVNRGYEPDGMWQMAYSGVGGHMAAPFGTDLARNPMWGLTDYRTSAGMGHEWKDLQSPTTYGSESLTTSGGTCSLASSRSLPDLTWNSNDPWLSHSGTEWSRDDPGDEKRPNREAVNDFDRSDGRPSLSASWTLNTGISSSTQTVNTDWQSSSVPATGSSTVTVNRIAGGRIEEGSIGSKKRIWFRAPNGQFASATQALSGNFAGDSNGGGGQGSAQGSSEGFRRIRRRRKSEEVERKYRCDYDGCDKAYGTLNHLNTHRATNDHGARLNAVGYRRAYAEWQRRQSTRQGA